VPQAQIESDIAKKAGALGATSVCFAVTIVF
jgi:hypothetical protein